MIEQLAEFRLKRARFFERHAALLPIRQICHVGDNRGTVTEFNRSVGGFTAAYAIDPICHVIRARTLAQRFPNHSDG